MGLRIANNIASLNTHRNLIGTDAALSKSLERLSSGFRINRASDDAAGLSVSMRFRAQTRSLRQASRNAAEANALLQVAEGAADQITNILSRMKQLATQAASSNTTSSDRTNISTEINTLEDEITRIAQSTKYGTSALVDGSFGTTSVSAYGGLSSTFDVVSADVSGASSAATYDVNISTNSGGYRLMVIGNQNGTTQTVTTNNDSITAGNTGTLDFGSLGISVVVDSGYDTTASGGTTTANGTFTTTSASTSFQIGSENDATNRVSFSLGDMTTSGLMGVNTGVDASSQSGAQAALDSIDSAISTLANNRATIGVAQNRLGFASANLATSIENITAAESTIRDADVAFETVDFTKNQILLQAGTAMLGQANLAPQVLLSLFT
jgi:flagellin